MAEINKAFNTSISKPSTPRKPRQAESTEKSHDQSKIEFIHELRTKGLTPKEIKEAINLQQY